MAHRSPPTFAPLPSYNDPVNPDALRPSLRPQAATFGLSDDEFTLVTQHLGREPNALEAAVFGALWSEHCGYKNSRPLLRTRLSP